MSHNPDFRDLFSALSDAEARFLVVGAYAAENATRVHAALWAFGAPLSDVATGDFATPQDLLDVANLEKVKPS